MLNTVQPLEESSASTDSMKPTAPDHESKNHNHHHQTNIDSGIIHSSSLSSPSSLIINEESPSSLSSVSSPHCSSSHSERSSSSRSASPDSKKSTSDGNGQDLEANEKEILATEAGGETNSMVNEEKIDSMNDEPKLQINDTEPEQEKLTEIQAPKSPMSETSSTKTSPVEEPEGTTKQNDQDQSPQAQPNKETSADKYEAMQPRLKKFLKIYQQSSKQSLGGPIANDIENLQQTDKNPSATSNSDDLSHSKPIVIASSPSSANCDSNNSTPSRDSVHYNDDLSKTKTNDNIEALNQSTNNQLNEHNNLSIIASVAAAAYFNQSLSRPADLNKLLAQQQQQSKDKTISHRQRSQSPHKHHNHHHSSHTHQSHGHHHPHKRAKFGHTTPRSSSNTARDHSSGPVQTKSMNSIRYLKCIQADSNTSPLTDVLFHGERISCFIVGGEKRLCLHHIINIILKEFSIAQINSACQKLQIACLESSVRQLEILKKSQLLPSGASNCGLLTQTNAERLCAYLMDTDLSQKGPVPPQVTNDLKQKIKVVHECFGKTYGHLHMSLYSRYDSACVECDTCKKLYTPKNFVCHSHRYESHTQHWGFDSANWRLYLKLASTGAAHVATTEDTAANNESAGILSDIKISNKDNIAANNTSGSQKTNPLHEEFEQFKKKFLNSDSNVSNSDLLKRKMQFENVEGCEPTPRSASKSFTSLNGVENSTKRLMTNSSSLNDLNNNLMKNMISNSTNPNVGSLNKTNEHKLLNGLLSKPLNAHNSPENIHNSENQHQNLLIPSNPNMSIEQIMKLNKLSSRPANTSMQKQMLTSDDFPMNPAQLHNPYSKPSQTGPSHNSLQYLINNSLASTPNKTLKKDSYMSSRMIGANSTVSSMEANMLELILNEIDSCVDNKESVDRLRQMIVQMQIYYNEKLSELQASRNKLMTEFDESKINYQCENEQLRCQLKLVQMQMQSEHNKEHYIKTSSSSNSHNPLQHLSSHSSLHAQQQQQQQQHHFQMQKQQETYKNNLLPSNKSPNQNLMAATHQIQMFLQQQQALQQKNQEFNVAATPTFPQFFLNNFVPSLQHRQNQPNLAIDPLTSTPMKKHSSSSFSSPSSQSTSPASLNNKSNSTSLNLNNSHLHQATA